MYMLATHAQPSCSVHTLYMLLWLCLCAEGDIICLSGSWGSFVAMMVLARGGLRTMLY